MKNTTIFKVFITLIIIFVINTGTLISQAVNKSFKVNKGGTVTVSIEGGDIKIQTWDKGEVYLNATGLSNEAAKDLETSQSGNDVNITFRHRHGSSGNLVFEIFIPNQFNTKTTTSGGDISIKGALSGNVNGKTSGGDIHIENINGEVNMSTSGGDVSADNIEGNCELRTSGGDISLGNVSGEIKVSTSGGDIRVKAAKKSLKVNTSGGDIEIGDVNGDIKATTSGGDIRVGNSTGQVTLTTSGGDISLSGSNGKTSAITSGGDLDLKNVSGSVIAKTSGGDVSVELYPGGNGKSELISSGGDINLSIPSSSKANIEATIKISGRWSKGSEEYKVMSDFKPDSYEKNESDEEIRAKYTINGGGEKIILRTNNSNIKIKSFNK